MTADPPTPRDLAAGRELDAEVAEKVMGWHLVPAKGISPPGWAKWYDSAGDAQAAGVGGGFKPSIDIAAAWKVLDEMVWRVGTANIRIDMEDYGRGAGTSPTGAERAVWVTIGEHTAVGPAPLAICRAALAAIVQSQASDGR